MLHGTIVNLGCKWVDEMANLDHTWHLLRHLDKVDDSHFRFVGFEPNAAQLNVTMATANRKLSPKQMSEVTLVNDYVQVETVLATFRQLSIPRAPHLLKIDVDSIDWQLLDVILLEYAPAVIFVEFMRWIPLPLEFKALAAHSGRKSSFFRGYRGFNKIFPCGGSSLAAWNSLSQRHHYDIIADDGKSNIVMVRTRYKDLFDQYHLRCAGVQASAESYRIGGGVQHRLDQFTRLDNFTSAATIIEARCAENDTPFSLHANDACLCKHESAHCFCDADERSSHPF